MYFPYFRGRQYDLLALKELAQNDLISSKIIPVIEPVKASSTLSNTIQIFNGKGLPLAIILNPEVGIWADENASILFEFGSGVTIPALLMNELVESKFQDLKMKGISIEDMLIILNNQDYVGEYKDDFRDVSPRYTLFPDERPMRRSVRQNKVLFEDKFQKQERNSDYLKRDDEPFSEDHLYYEDEGYCGFGDYSIIGNNYEESGFSPRAVAIHIVYFDNDNTLRIHHFVSDANYGIEDVAGKFGEAVAKLKAWYNRTPNLLKQKTSALSVLLEYAESGYYPGLPTIKKLSIMHHLELMNRYLNGEIIL